MALTLVVIPALFSLIGIRGQKDVAEVHVS